ncbi:hypothetical protein AMK59_1242 [Oryctes borbonicus]|uniref:Uncharacterized protein n=1 Tax=Oryctes borbonicus TaxID=1629725 RepID=A0A0T6BCV3_9SCAR|nr:hypothetical protein AMK59_1242 [Oryctes borbonicus]
MVWFDLSMTLLLSGIMAKTLPGFLDNFNRQHPDINFTMVIEYNNVGSFLNVLVTRNSDGSLSHSVYRKPTHTNRYLLGSPDGDSLSTQQSYRAESCTEGPPQQWFS